MIKVGKDIVIENCPDDVREELRKKLTFKNPDYEKKIRLGKWIGNTPPTLCLMVERGHDMIVPYGMFDDVIDYIHNIRLIDRIELKDEIEPNVDFSSNIKLYDYQEKAVKSAFSDGHGVIVAPCGSGKTQIGLELAAQIGRRTLWLTHTQDLLRQSMERAKSVYDLPESAYGTITAGKVQCGDVITFATVQTAAKADLSALEDYFDTIIVDECHHCVGTPTRLTMFYKVLSSLNAPYKFGLTATPERTDGLEGCMYAILGPKVCEITQEDVAHTTCPLEVVTLDSYFKPDYEEIINPDGTISYSKLIDEIVSNKQRNEIIVDNIVWASKYGTCLVLTERIAHINTLFKMLVEKDVPCAKITGASTKSAKEARALAIELLRSGRIKVLIATYTLAKEGLDVPSLRNLFLVTPQKNETTIQQSVGRVTRKAPNKKRGIVYDYVDNMPMLESWYKKRKKIYDKCFIEYT